MQDPAPLCRHAGQRLVEALRAKGAIRLHGPQDRVVEHVAAALAANFREEIALEKEAERLADAHLDQSPTLSRHKVVQLVKRRLAEERNFAL